MESARISREFWKGKNVFVTGASGFLGSWIAKFLSDSGAEVVCLIRDSVPNSNFNRLGLKEKVKVADGDFNDFETVDRILNEYEIDTVFHLGAQTIVSIANRNPTPTLKTNIMGSINIFEACRRNPTIKRIIVASSDKAYGTHDKLPYDEETPLKGEHPYDVSKSCMDLIAKMYHKTYNLPVCITRCGNLYGPGDLNFNRIFPGVIKDIHNNKSPIIRSDGKFVRSYFYVKDAALAYIMLAESMEEKNLFGHAFNFSTDEKISVLDLVNQIIKKSGFDLQPTILNETKNEIKEQYLSSEKAKGILGWKTKYSFEEGLGETIDWYREFLKDKDEIHK